MKRFRMATAIAALALVLASCGGGETATGPDGNELTTITMAVGATTANSIPIWLGQEHGIFARHGLEIEMVLLPGADAPPALAAGSVQIASSGVPDMAGAIVAGSPMRIIGISFPYAFFKLMGRQGLSSPAELAGGTIAVSTPGSSSDGAVQAAMDGTGLVRGEDYEVVFIGDNGARMAALEQGVVDATITSPPTANQLELRGYPVLADLIEDEVQFGYSSFGVNVEWAEENREVLLSYLRAYIEAVAFAKENEAAAHQAMRDNLNIEDQALLEEVYDEAIGHQPPIPRADVETVAATLSWSPEQHIREADPASMIDNQYMDEVERTAG